MKKLVFILLTIGMTFTGVANTTPTPSVELKSVNAKRFSLYVKTLYGETSVTIKDDSGKLIFTEKLKKGYIYRKTFDISDLPEVTYIVNVKDGESSKTYSITKEKIILVEEEFFEKK